MENVEIINYESNVLFVDILGIGALTSGALNVTKEHLISHGASQLEIDGVNPKHYQQFLAARILERFRNLLFSLNDKFCDSDKNRNVSVAQLSDCVFLWSFDIPSLLKVCYELMFGMIKVGILCRGGIAHGNIFGLKGAPQDENSLGEYVVGSAVTQAVQNERKGKGCRVFSDETFFNKVSSTYKDKTSVGQVFKILENPGDCSSFHEINWWLLPKLYEDLNYANIYEILLLLKHSPLFAFNTLNDDGVVQLKSSVKNITKSLTALLKSSELPVPEDLKHKVEVEMGYRDPQVIAQKMNLFKELISAPDL